MARFRREPSEKERSKRGKNDMGSIDHLFIVGAGFSHHAGLPLTTGFTEQLLATKKFYASSASSMMVKFLRKFVADTFDHDVSVAARYWPELEDIFTCVDLSANSGHHLGAEYSPSQLRTVRRALIVRTIRMLRQTFIAGKATQATEWRNLQRFFQRLDKSNCAFLRMNWDTVIEEGLTENESTGLDYGCEAMPARFAQTGIRLLIQTSDQLVSVLKPHGSTNWLYCDACRQLFWFPPSATYRIADQLFAERDWDVVSQAIGETHKSAVKRACPVCGATALGTRFATFSYRKALDFPMHARSWLSAENLLREARNWIFIGYSLPAADYEFKHLLKRVQLSRRSRPTLVLVSGGKGAKETRRNYQKIFGPHFRSDRGTFFDDGIDRTVLTKFEEIGALNPI